MFEVIAKDLLGRIGRIETKSGRFETPAFFPVINPVSQAIPASYISERFGCKAVITNAYIIYRRLRDEGIKKGVHGLISFNGIVMTDSGGYQMLEYGDVAVAPKEIAEFQEAIGSDMAVPLDVPTGLVSYEKAKDSVEKTLANIMETLEVLNKGRRALWAAPIQGGTHLQLLEYCASRLVEMPFDFFALGSPTPLMEGYMFARLFKMISTVKRIIPSEKPLHLFGAGHPMLMPFVVAMGCDTFDSASYYLYAKEGRYMVSSGTLRLSKLDYFPCECEVCSKYSPEELRSLSDDERVKLLSLHNLSVCFREVMEIKQAIKDGRLIELLEIRARSHPRLYAAFRTMLSDGKLIELMKLHTPVSKRRGMNLFDRLSLLRPEVSRARSKLMEYVPTKKSDTIVLIPQVGGKLKSVEAVERLVKEKFPEFAEKTSYGFFLNPYGVVPVELKFVYPFSQTNFSTSLLMDAKENIIGATVNYVVEHGYEHVVLLNVQSPSLRELVMLLKSKLEEKRIRVSTL
ncbi:MAG: tRNA guanosine(15) transglycosylase TgtA [Nitrososphaerota archaeon]|nr:tRNA guanosine(15) transglycosylase TgtA [Aigarchaeota archaeon]MDW8077160.1 tRNA guanosine(15) transglycosylase TgtA [Nitrososphaerota archaeon]